MRLPAFLKTPLPSRTRPAGGRPATVRLTPVPQCAPRGPATTAGQGPNLDIEAAIPMPVLDPRFARDCICDPRRVEIGGYDRFCPRHDLEACHVRL